LRGDIFLTTEFQRLGLTTYAQQAELVQSHLSSYLDTLNRDELEMLRLSLLLEYANNQDQVRVLLDMIAAQFAILEANGERLCP
jgi:hypothetical protein